MSFNGSGTFVINSSGQPVVANTVISSTVFNALTADLATGLSTCITKDGQTTPTANIPMGTFKFTNLGNGSAATDSATLGQVQASTTKLVTVTGADTIAGTMNPALTAYASGQMFYFIAAGANTGAVTLNIDGLGARNVTRDGSTALAANDILSGEVALVVYDGTRFQLLNPANAGSMTVSNLTVTGTTTLSGLTASTALALDASKNVVSVTNTGTGNNVLATSPTLTTPNLGTPSTLTLTNATGLPLSTGVTGTLPVANGGTGITAFGTGVATALGQNVTGSGGIVLATSPTLVTPTLGAASATSVAAGLGAVTTPSYTFAGDLNTGLWSPAADTIAASTGGSERLRLDSSGNLGIGTASPGSLLDVVGTATGSGIAASVRNNATTGNSLSAFRLFAHDGSTVANSGTVFLSANSWTYQQIAANQLNIYGVKSGGIRLATANSGPIIFAPTTGADADFAVESMRLTPAGNLGIGTASPAVRLHVNGTGTTTTRISANTSGNAVLELNAEGTDGGAVSFNRSTVSMEISTSGGVVGQFDGSRNATIGAGTLATTATNGFLYVPTCAGTPTGTPTAKSGFAPIVVDTTNNKLYFYSTGVWRDAGP